MTTTAAPSEQTEADNRHEIVPLKGALAVRALRSASQGFARSHSHHEHVSETAKTTPDHECEGDEE